MGGDLRALTNQRHIHMHQNAAARGNPPRSMAQEFGAISILPCGLRGREPAANIAFRQRAVNRITKRMQPNIGIRMSIKTKIMRDINATQD